MTVSAAQGLLTRLTARIHGPLDAEIQCGIPGNRASAALWDDDCRKTGVPVQPLDELRTLVAEERVAAIVTPENPRRVVAPLTIEAARTGADRPGCCLPAALRCTPCRDVGRQLVGRIVVRASF